MVEKTERAVASRLRQDSANDKREGRHDGNSYAFARDLEPEQFAQPLCLSTADWNLALLLIIHAQLIRTLEPRHDLTYSVDVHQVRAVSSPEHSGIEAVK